MINIRFRKSDIGAAIFNGVLIFIGFIMFYLAYSIGQGFAILGALFFVFGLYPFSKSKGVLVDVEGKWLYPYNAALWIKTMNKIPTENFESIVVTTGTEIHKGGMGTLVNRRPTISFMVYKLYLIPNPYLKVEKVLLGDFYTKKECMMAAEELSKISALPLIFKPR